MSSLSAETQALRTMEDEMHMVRLELTEFTGTIVELDEHDSHVSSVPGVAILDAKAIYDALTGRNQAHSLLEKSTAIELLAYMEATKKNGTMTRWVHGEAKIADGLTKAGAEKILIEFM